jgi:hypothetical protein
VTGLNKTDKEVIEEIRTYTGLGLADIVKVFEWFNLYALTSYSEGEEIRIPYYGKTLLKLKEDGELTGFFSPSKFLNDMIKGYEKAKKTGEYYNINLVKKLKNKSNEILEKQMEG